jgi:aldose 1-epimerase
MTTTRCELITKHDRQGHTSEPDESRLLQSRWIWRLCLDHELWLATERYTPADDQLIPTGQIATVRGTPLDFTKATRIGARIAQLKPKPGGYDHNFVLDSDPQTLLVAARVVDAKSGRIMEMRTTQPGVQLYSGNHLKHAGLCLETQHYPDSVNHPEFPTTVLRPGETFKRSTAFAFSAK